MFYNESSNFIRRLKGLAMADTISQIVWGSEQDYVNTTHWHISPFFRMIQNGETEQLRASLNLELDRYDYRQRA